MAKSPYKNYKSPRDYKVFNMGNEASPPFKMKGMSFRDERPESSALQLHDGTEEGTPEWAETHDPETGSPLNQGVVDPAAAGTHGVGNVMNPSVGMTKDVGPGVGVNPGAGTVPTGFPYKVSGPDSTLKYKGLKKKAKGYL